jgi:hypothetical protein
MLNKLRAAAIKEGRELTLSEIVRYALDAVAGSSYAEVADHLHERRGRPKGKPVRSARPSKGQR